MLHIVIGTKAQFIKIAPLIVLLQKKGMDFNFIVTGQHHDSINELRENFGIRAPDVTLYAGKDITGLPDMFLWMLRILIKTFWHKDDIFKKHGVNDIVIVHGDTFSTLLGALMGKAAGKKVAHVESGLRSFNIFHPFPEELTRIIVFYLADVYFCPGKWAVDNLRKYKGKKIDTHVNTLYDSVVQAKQNLQNTYVEIPDTSYAVVSLHRFENIFNKTRFRLLIGYLKKIAKEMKLLFILHMPTRKQLEKHGLYNELAEIGGIELRPRYDYFQFIKLVMNCEFVITDGGSNQEETYYLGKPTILFRKTTERQEGLTSNITVSEYDWNIIDNFVKNYKNLAGEMLFVDITPSEIIIDNLREYS